MEQKYNQVQRKIVKYKDVHLEIWKGFFSGGGGQRNKENCQKLEQILESFRFRWNVEGKIGQNGKF